MLLGRIIYIGGYATLQTFCDNTQDGKSSGEVTILLAINETITNHNELKWIYRACGKTFTNIDWQGDYKAIVIVVEEKLDSLKGLLESLKRKLKDNIKECWRA